MPHLEFISSVIPYVTISKYLLDLLEMQTVIKQAICVSVLHMCCKYGNKQHVTKPPRKYVFLPKQPKENTEKNHKLDNFLFCLAIRCRNTKTLPLCCVLYSFYQYST